MQNTSKNTFDNENPFEEPNLETLLNTDQDPPAEDPGIVENNVIDEPTKLKEEVAVQKDKYIRLFAEFDNYKRRSARENMEIRQTAGKEIIISLLEVLDDCDRAEKQLRTSEDIKQIREGVILVFNKLRATLLSKGVTAMDSLHTDFDSEKHEAIAEVPATDKDLKGKVMDQIEKGYYLNDKLIRFAKVVVGK